MSVMCLNFMYRGEEALCCLAQTLFCLWGSQFEGGGGVTQNSLLLKRHENMTKGNVMFGSR